MFSSIHSSILLMNRYLKNIAIKFKIRFPNKINFGNKAECIIFGSGPSLDILNDKSAFLKDKDFIGCNFIHKHTRLHRLKFRIYSVIDRDYTVALKSDYLTELDSMHFIMATKNAQLAPWRVILSGKTSIVGTAAFDPSRHSNYFSGDTAFLTGNSIPFLIQVAIKLGRYKRIYLYGVDHYSSVQSGSSSNFIGYEGRAIKNLNISEQKLQYLNTFYEYVHKLAERSGVEVINVTPGSKLDIFECKKIDFLVRHSN